MTDPRRRAIVLLSGGLDSATTLALARTQGFACFALTFAYGQRHAIEIDAARQVAAQLDAIDHKVVTIDLRAFGGSALTAEIDVPHGLSDASVTPVTYVPARNTIFLAYALAWAEVVGAYDIFIGVNAVDYSGYPDCRPEFLAAFQRLAQFATRAGVEGGDYKIHAPLVDMPKDQIIRTGLELGVDYALTRSCYDPDDAGRACGQCESCILRRRGFEAAGIDDPTPYKPSVKGASAI